MKKYYIIIPIIGFLTGFLCRWVSFKSKGISGEDRMYKVLTRLTMLERRIIEDGADLFNVSGFREIKFVRWDRLMYPLFDE